MRISDWSSDVCSSDLTKPIRHISLKCGVCGPIASRESPCLRRPQAWKAARPCGQANTVCGIRRVGIENRRKGHDLIGCQFAGSDPPCLEAPFETTREIERRGAPNFSGISYVHVEVEFAPFKFHRLKLGRTVELSGGE